MRGASIGKDWPVTVDATEQTLLDGLDHENPMTRLKAAACFLRLSKAARRRGSAHHEAVEPQTVTPKWIDWGRRRSVSGRTLRRARLQG
jgi:hypothetical protein